MSESQRLTPGAIRKNVELAVQPYHLYVDAFRKQLIATTLRAHDGNRTRAARALGLQRTYLIRLLRNFGLKDGKDGRRRIRRFMSPQAIGLWPR